MEYAFPESAVARYDELAGAAGNGAVDGQTWDDLLLPAYLAQLGSTASIFGRQMLYRRLRRGQDGSASVRTLLADNTARERLATRLAPLRRASAEVSEALFVPLPPAPRWSEGLWLLPLAFFASVAASFFWLPALALTLVLSLLQLRGIEKRVHYGS